MALRSFNELRGGTQFPPERERSRVANMDKWALRSGRRFEDDSLRLKPNGYRFLMNFWSGTVLSLAPEFRVSNARGQQAMDLLAPSLVHAAREVVADMIRYGMGAFVQEVPWVVDSLDPRAVFKVEKPELRQHIGFITALTYLVNTTQGQTADHIALTYYRGEEVALRRFYQMDNLTIGKSAARTERLPATPPVLVVQGEGEYGTSDFEDADEYIKELHRRETAVSEALDKHANPHLGVPEGVLQQDSQGNYIISEDGIVIPVPEGSQNPEYVTWDADFNAQAAAMQRAQDRIQRFSRIAPVLTAHRDETDTPGLSLPSGAALRRLALVTVQRIYELRDLLGPAMRLSASRAFETVRRAGGDAPMVDPDDIEIEWPAPLHVEEDVEESVGGQDDSAVDS